MDVPKPLFRPHFRASLALLAALAAPLLATPAAAVQERTAKPDQVLWINRRGAPATATGTVTESSLTQVVLETGGSSRTFAWNEVQRITFGAAPPSYHDGIAYYDRGDFANAAAEFRLAASDASARDVVRASARLWAIEALMRHGAEDPNAFDEARKDADLFVSEHAQSRELPRAWLLLGRATLLSGEAALAAEVYRGLYDEVAGDAPTPGYPRVLGFRAGLAAADALIRAGEAAKAREIFSAMEGTLPIALAALDEGAPERDELTAIQAQARLGEGFVLLGTSSIPQAKTFFEGQARNADARNTALRFGAKLGLAEALYAQGDYRAAQIEFAQVSAVDHTDRDRVARALVGLAECALKLSDSNARTDARTWIDTVQAQYGDTPAVLKAQELSKTL